MGAPSSFLCALLLLAAFACHFNGDLIAPRSHGRRHHSRNHGHDHDHVNGLGVNYGTIGDNLPTAAHSVKLLRSVKAGAVKIYDANQDILHALAGTGIPVSVMVPNEIIPKIAASRRNARRWVAKNLSRHPRVKIIYLLVGNELLSNQAIAGSTWGKIVPAMKNLRRALHSYKLGHVKLGTPLAMSALSASFPPSAGEFREDIAESVMKPLLQFLSDTRSYFFIDVYPYFAWVGNQKDILLDYALFQSHTTDNVVDPGSKLIYTNLLDQMLDATIAAMAKLGYPDVPLAISETGWPSGGGDGANVVNAETYNRHLATRMSHTPGTPARPDTSMPVFVFSLYNEDLKPGAGTERHWGMFYPNGSSVYDVDLTGKHYYAPPPPGPEPVPPAKGKWCVLATTKPVNETAVEAGLNYACGQGGAATCAAIQPGGTCFEPNTLDAHASYAFNAYWQQFKKTGATCSFNGLAETTTNDPSHGSCKFPTSSDETVKGEWCVLEIGSGNAVNETAVEAGMNYACGKATCAAIQPGGACYEPNTLDSHASYAFNSYWQQFKNTGATCSFNGLAVKTTKDPSYGSCTYPSTPS
ncbi:probable glucan endo-1,3-beta-glucosidase A6 [Lolium rigidum]|uniref:probable glucan endo-1,3-beta-glucosidase A6 n=1 Tax=Lolium rigidum TaxID=89674 RepID=UPI001F5C932E|nr:probable glucan endo-1,3-beta-glucosidase A6 [Lolium rigidum]